MQSQIFNRKASFAIEILFYAYPAFEDLKIAFD